MKLKNFLPVIGIIIFIYIIFEIGIENIYKSFLLINPIFFLLASALIIPRVLLSSYKWLFICKIQKINLPLSYITKIFLISVFYGIVTPASLGGYVSIFYIKKKANISYEKSITNSLLDASTEFISGLFLALMGSVFLIKEYPGIFSTLLFIFLFVLVIFIIFLRKEKGEFLFNLFILRFLPEKIKLVISKSFEKFYEDIPRFRDLLFPIFLEIIVWLIMGIQVYIIALGFGIDIPILKFILVYIISFIAGIIPISTGGLGVREGALVFVLSVFSVNPQIAFVVSILGFVLTNLIPGSIGGFYSLKQKDGF